MAREEAGKPHIHMVGSPMDLGGDRRGTDMGPSALRYARLAKHLEAIGCQVTDLGDLDIPIPESLEPGDPSRRYLGVITEVWHRLADITARICRDEGFPLVLGGDHSITVGAVAGAARHFDDLGVIWVDAHGDMNDPDITPSGNIHGMGLAAIVGLTTEDILAALPAGLPLDPGRAVLIGVRDLDPLEKIKIRRSDVTVFTMKDVDEMGIARVTRKAWEIASDGGRGSVHLSFDLDVIDPALAGGVGTPVPGGLTYREAHLLMELAAEMEGLVSADITEVNPILDNENNTAVLAVGLLASMFGKTII